MPLIDIFGSSFPFSFVMLYVAYVLVVGSVILLDHKSPQSTLAWLLTICMLPFIGLPLYLITGRNWRRKKLVQQNPEELLKRFAPAVPRIKHLEGSDKQKFAHMIQKCCGSAVTEQNNVRVFETEAQYFDELCTDLRSAQQHIHIEMFIWKSDPLGERIGEILRERAEAGVEVRVLVDRIGSLCKVSKKYRQHMKKSGVDFRYFLGPLSVINGLLSNYLNHRKMVIIDGSIGYTGGMNIGEEYLTGGKKFASWRDLGMKIQGEATEYMQAIFIADWFNTTKKWLRDRKYFPENTQKSHTTQVQIVCSGPDSQWFAIKQLYFNMIVNANKRVWIQSPYFIPDESIVTALTTAALSGIDVRLMMTGHPDKYMPFWAAKSYYRPLLEAGGKIYQYNRGFLHSKMILFDDDIVSIGSCNLDIRSFELDYEMNTIMYDQEVTKQMVERFQTDMSNSQEVLLKHIKKQHFLTTLRNAILRIFSPMM